MTRSRRLLYQTGLVATMAAISMARARSSEAATEPMLAPTEPMFCTGAACTNDCGEVWTSIHCSDCGGDAFPFCENDLWDCPGFAPFLFGCAYATD